MHGGFCPQILFFILKRACLPFNQNDSDSLVKHLFPPAPYNTSASTLSSFNTVKWFCGNWIESLTDPRLNSSPDRVELQPGARPPLFCRLGFLLCEMWVTIPLPRSFRDIRALSTYLLYFSFTFITLEVLVPLFRLHRSHPCCSPLCCTFINDIFINDTLRDPVPTWLQTASWEMSHAFFSL